MATEKANKDAVVRKTVTFLPGIPTGEVSPEERAAMKVNNPEAFADLTRYEKAHGGDSAPPEKPTATSSTRSKPKAAVRAKAGAATVKADAPSAQDSAPSETVADGAANIAAQPTTNHLGGNE